MIDAVRNDDLYIVTHKHYGGHMQARCDAMLAAFEA